jgi:hypothetical protein
MWMASRQTGYSARNGGQLQHSCIHNKFEGMLVSANGPGKCVGSVVKGESENPANLSLPLQNTPHMTPAKK